MDKDVLLTVRHRGPTRTVRCLTLLSRVSSLSSIRSASYSAMNIILCCAYMLFPVYDEVQSPAIQGNERRS